MNTATTASFSLPKKRTGRPTKLTPQILSQLKKAFALGLDDEQAASVVGVSDVTLTMWKRNPEFMAEIRGAVNKRLMLRLKRIEDGKEGWQGCGWLLERLLPRQWAKPEVQFNIQNTHSTTNIHNQLTITIQAAENIKQRVTEIDAEVDKLFEARPALSPPGETLL